MTSVAAPAQHQQAPQPDAHLEAGGPAGTAGSTRGRTIAIIVLFLLIAAIGTALLAPKPPVTAYLSPASTTGTGAEALADILAERGHPVTVAQTVPSAVTDAAAGGTLVITSPQNLSDAQLGSLSRVRAALLIVQPTSASLAVLAPELSLAGAAPAGTLTPGCTLTAATLAGSIHSGAAGTLAGLAGAAHVQQCYRDQGRPTLVQLPVNGRLVTVLGSGAPLSNASLGAQGDAALAINLLSAGRRVTWLVPSPTAAAAAKSFTSLVPRTAYLVIAQLALAVLLLALCRGRRLGPLVTERLPVVVRASETAEGHGALYRSRRARDRAAAALRAAMLGRIGPAIGLPRDAGPDAVTAALAGRTSLTPEQLAALLYGQPPGSDQELLELASQLDAVEGEVRAL